jgi:hypothetical protein
VTADQSSSIARDLSRAEKLKGASEKAALASLATRLDRDAKTAADPTRVEALAGAVRDLAKR